MEGRRRRLELEEVFRVVYLEGRSMKSQDSIGIWSDFQDFQEDYALGRLEKVVSGRRVLKFSGS